MRIIAWLADDILDSEVSRMEITLSLTLHYALNYLENVFNSCFVYVKHGRHAQNLNICFRLIAVMNF